MTDRHTHDTTDGPSPEDLAPREQQLREFACPGCGEKVDPAMLHHYDHIKPTEFEFTQVEGVDGADFIDRAEDHIWHADCLFRESGFFETAEPRHCSNCWNAMVHRPDDAEDENIRVCDSCFAVQRSSQPPKHPTGGE